MPPLLSRKKFSKSRPRSVLEAQALLSMAPKERAHRAHVEPDCATCYHSTVITADFTSKLFKILPQEILPIWQSHSLCYTFGIFPVFWMKLSNIAWGGWNIGICLKVLLEHVGVFCCAHRHFCYSSVLLARPLPCILVWIHLKLLPFWPLPGIFLFFLFHFVPAKVDD